MKRFFVIFGAVFALLAGSFQGAEAQERSVIFGVTGGTSFLTGELADEFDTGLHINGLVQTNRLGSLPFGLRGEVGYQKFTHDDDSLTHLLGRVSAVIPFATRPDAQPYLFAGVGIYNTKEETDHGDHAHGGEAENLFGFGGGVGVRWRLGGVNLLVETGFHNVRDEAHPQRFIPLTLGIVF